MPYAFTKSSGEPSIFYAIFSERILLNKVSAQAGVAPLSKQQPKPTDHQSREDSVSKLEKVLARNPSHPLAATRLLMLLDLLSPQIPGTGPYSKCQKELSRATDASQLSSKRLHITDFLRRYDQWQSILNNFSINQSLPITQLYEGTQHHIGGKDSFCGKFLSFFKEKKIIPKFCYDCYKVQILPCNVLSLIEIYFLLKFINFPRDNFRKCMVEVREAVRFPYKAYVFCNSEEEAKLCLAIFKSELSNAGIPPVYCAITHGCSEYGLEYPDFKFSKDGTHHLFESPDFWKEEQDKFEVMVPDTQPDSNNYNTNEITIRDLIVFGAWIQYAKLAGDEAHRHFEDTVIAEIPKELKERVTRQAHLRKAQISDLQSMSRE